MSGSDSTILSEDNLALFFYEQIEAAQNQKQATLRKDVEAYVVNLLARFALRVGHAGRKSPAFALQLLEAQEQGAEALREVGDRALFVAGVVPQSLAHSAVDEHYVCSIGAQAYRSVFLERRQLDLFDVLANTFVQVAEVMREVATPFAPKSDKSNLIGLYEQWLEKGDRDSAKDLIEAGVRITRPKKPQVH